MNNKTNNKGIDILHDKSIGDLRMIAQSLGLKLGDNLSKSDLINLISTTNLNADIKGTQAGEFENKDLDSMSLIELRDVAEKIGIKSPYKYKKSDLRSLIDQEQSKRIDLESKSISELREMAKSAEITNTYNYKKSELVDLLSDDIEDNDYEDVDYIETDDNNEDDEPSLAELKGIDLEDLSENASNLLESMSDINYVGGILEVMQDGYGFLRRNNYLSSEDDVYVSPSQIKRFKLKTGDNVIGVVKPPSSTEKFNALIYINHVNDRTPASIPRRRNFEDLIPIYPEERITLETSSDRLATRLIDLISPLGKGQRGLIVSQPKSGKTTLLKMIAHAIEEKYPDIKLIVLLVDERPEEVTDMKKNVKGEVVYSTFDEQAKNHIKVAEMVIERAKRLVEQGDNVVILLDSITKLARAYNLVTPPSGKTLSGGLDPLSFYKPKKFFGAARNIENGGSLTILATALVETGSRMDDIIYEEFKGTGNMEIILDRKLSERRIFPAIDIYKSGTRKEELLLSREELEAVTTIRRAMSELSTQEVTEMVLEMLETTNNNKEWLNLVKRRGIGKYRI